MNIDLNTAMDVEQLLNGGFKPLSTFLNFEQLDSVLKKMRLPTGEIWPIPVLFPKPSESISTGMTLLLKFRKQNLARFIHKLGFSFRSICKPRVLIGNAYFTNPNRSFS